jgi:hypothetical protein
MTTPLKFKLQNGLNATLHAPRSAGMRRIWNECTNQDQIEFSRSSLFAIEVEVEGEHIYVVYWVLSDAYFTCKRLEDRMSVLDDNCYIIYNHIAHEFLTPPNDTLMNAIIHKLKPSLAALMAPWDKQKP